MALRHALSLWRDPISLFEELAREQGDIAHVRIGWRDLYLLNRAELAQELLAADHDSFGKGYSLTRTRFLLGNGLLTSEGDFHARQRRLIRPAFHGRRLQSYAAVMAGCAEQACGRWRDEEPRNIVKDMMRLSQRIVAKCLFGTDIEDADSREASASLDEVIRGFRLLMLPFSPGLVLMPVPAMARLRRARTRLDRLIYNMIDERRRSGDRGDVLSMLLLAEDERGEGMDDRQVGDEAMTLFLAGHDTMGNALAWTWYLLSQNGDAEARWHDELDRVLGGRPPTADDLHALTLTRGVLAESMRLYPPVWSVGRQARRTVRLGGRTMQAGAIVQVCQWLLHRDPTYWQEPESFVPERWSADFERGLPRGAYLPFGLGPRLCIGMQFAWMAGTLALATIGQAWRLELDPAQRIATLQTITLRPRFGLTMVPRRPGRRRAAQVSSEPRPERRPEVA